MAYFTQRWLRSTVNRERFSVESGQMKNRLDHTASNLFTARGVTAGDTVYIIQFAADDLCLIGRIQVAEICDAARAEKLLGYEPWEAQEHAVATKDSMKPYRFDLVVPKANVSDIVFIRAKGDHKSPALNVKGKIGQQTFRGVSEITEPTARMFDRLLGP